MSFKNPYTTFLIKELRRSLNFLHGSLMNTLAVQRNNYSPGEAYVEIVKA